MRPLANLILLYCCFFALSAQVFACPTGSPILYVPDIEGRSENIDSLLHNLKARGWLEGTNEANFRIKSGRCVIFIGDMGDQGAGSKRSYNLALSLFKNSDQGAVTLISGNRENFFDLPTQLSLNDGMHKIPTDLQPWIEKQIKEGKNKEFFERIAFLHDAPEQAGESISEDLMKKLLNDRVVRLDYLHATKRGAAGAFAFERIELARMAGKFKPDGSPDAQSIPQIEVVKKYIDSIERGERGEYLVSSRLGAYDAQKKTLVVHSAVSQELLGILPNGEHMPSPDGSVDIERWVAAHNEDFQHWVPKAKAGDPVALSYLRGMTANPASFLYGNFGDADKKIKMPALPLSQTLKKSGVNMVIVGHKPVGDIAVPIVDPDTGVVYLFTDTSFSSHKQLPLVIQGGDGKTQVISKLKKSDGTFVDVFIDIDPAYPDVNLGKINADTGEICAGYIKEGRSRTYVYYKEGEGFKPNYTLVPESQLASIRHFKAGDSATPRMTVTHESAATRLAENERVLRMNRAVRATINTHTRITNNDYVWMAATQAAKEAEGSEQKYVSALRTLFVPGGRLREMTLPATQNVIAAILESPRSRDSVRLIEGYFVEGVLKEFYGSHDELKGIANSIVSAAREKNESSYERAMAKLKSYLSRTKIMRDSNQLEISKIENLLGRKIAGTTLIPCEKGYGGLIHH